MLLAFSLVHLSRPPDVSPGRWRQISIATADASANCPASVSVGDGYIISCGGNDVLEFSSNGTFTATFSGSNVQGVGTWRLDGTKLLFFSRRHRMLLELTAQLQ